MERKKHGGPQGVRGGAGVLSTVSLMGEFFNLTLTNDVGESGVIF